MSARHFDILIVGAGQAGRRAGEAARAVAPGVSIAIVGEEQHPPYDRPPLSKELLLGNGAETLWFKRDKAGFAAASIDLILGERVLDVDLTSKTVRGESGDCYGFDKLILATGSRARRLSESADLGERVTTLRTLDEAQRVARYLHEGSRVVVIGAGFIGLEVASAALLRGASVIVLEAADRVLGRIFPAAISAFVERLHLDAGVDLRLNAKVKGFSPAPGCVVVETDLGALEADIVVVGIGVAPNVELAESAGLEVDDGIVVTSEGATSHPDVFAAGEVTRHPLWGGGHGRHEAWQVAELQAQAAGRSAAGAPTPFSAIPYFWSDQLGVNMQMFGNMDHCAKLISRNDKGALFFALDPKGSIQGVVGFNAGADMSVAKRMLGALAPPDLADLVIPLRNFLRAAKKD